MLIRHQNATTRLRTARRGFTLLEILIVLAIIGVIAAMAVPNLLGNRDAAYNQQAKITLDAVLKAAELYSVKSGAYPNTIDQLLTPIQAGQGAEMEKKPLDPWGRDVFYEYPNTKASIDKPAIWSAGKNGQNENGGGDDIASWNI